jgi:hypothetical protein
MRYFMEDLHREHTRGDLVDCTHYCYWPMLYRPMYAELLARMNTTSHDHIITWTQHRIITSSHEHNIASSLEYINTSIHESNFTETSRQQTVVGRGRLWRHQHMELTVVTVEYFTLHLISIELPCHSRSLDRRSYIFLFTLPLLLIKMFNETNP